MKLLIILWASALFLFFATLGVSHAATTTVTTVTKTTVVKPASHYKKAHKHTKHYCYCKHYKHKKHKKHVKNNYRIRSYYSPAYCVTDSSACGGVVCYPAQYYQCRTEYYHHAGRNTARVEVCN